jgi:DNA polymerase-3 subunit gamma/tau
LDQVVAAGGVASRSEPVDDLVDALAGADAGAAVQAVAAALAEGHDPRVLAEAVLSVLRDAFLCSVGVEVPQLLDADRAQAERWAGELGTRRLTRALERIGTALVDMRHAADARVPLEVALVSLTSDQDRLAELERRVAELEEGGVRSAPAARRSAASAAAVAGSGAVVDSAPAADDGAVGEANDRGSVPAAASEDPPRTGSSPAPGGAAARAAQARAALDASAAGRRGSGGATGPPPTRPAARPAAPRRPGSGESSNPVAGADVAASAPGSERTVEAPDSAPEQPSGAPAAGADVDPAADGAVSPEPRSAAAPSTAVPSTGAPLADEWVRASLADNVLPSLKGRARALVAQAAVERVEGSTVLLGVANEATMARAEEFVPQVADLLSAAAGRPVEVALVVAGSPVAATRGAEPLPERAPMEDSGSTDDAVRAGAAPPGGDDPSSTEDELVDLDELEDASDVATTGVARLTQAFPGAVVVDSEGTT